MLLYRLLGVEPGELSGARTHMTEGHLKTRTGDPDSGFTPGVVPIQ